MSEQEKKQQRIYDSLNAETKPKKISSIIGVSLWSPSSLDLDPLDYAIWSILENKTKLPIQILICLRLVLKKNGIKYQKNLF